MVILDPSYFLQIGLSNLVQREIHSIIVSNLFRTKKVGLTLTLLMF